MYKTFNLTLSKGQKMEIVKSTSAVKIRLTAKALSGGSDRLMLTNRQISRIRKNVSNGKGVVLTLSKSQIQAMKRKGGFLPFILPIIGAIAAAATGAATIAKTVQAKQASDAAAEEERRHNLAVEAQLGKGLRLGRQVPEIGSGLKKKA